MQARPSRRRMLEYLWGGVAATLAAPPVIVAIGSSTLGDKLEAFDPNEAKTAPRIAFLFSGRDNRHTAAIEMYDKGEIDALVVLGVSKEDRTKFIRKARLNIQRKERAIAHAHGTAITVGSAMITRNDREIFFLKRNTSVDTSTDAVGACEWLHDNQYGWLKDKSSVTAIFISDTLHMPRCIRNLQRSLHIIPKDLQSRLRFTQLAIASSKITVAARLKEWGKLGIQRTTGMDRRPSILRKRAVITPELARR